MRGVRPRRRRDDTRGEGSQGPTITVDGRFAGTWSSKRAGKRLSVTIEPFEELEPATEEAIADEVADIGRFEDLTAALA